MHSLLPPSLDILDVDIAYIDNFLTMFRQCINVLNYSKYFMQRAKTWVILYPDLPRSGGRKISHFSAVQARVRSGYEIKTWVDYKVQLALSTSKVNSY